MNQYASIADLYKSDPVRFFTEVLDVKEEHIWSKMREIGESLVNNQLVCVKAGNSLSKSFTLGRIILWFLYTHYPSTVVTTAPSQTQVEDILWKEVATAHSSAKMPLGGKLLKTSLDIQVELGGPKWFATGFATKPDTVTTYATRFQGFHNENILIVFDEAAGILKEIWEAKDKLITNPRAKFICVGNPTVARGDFVDCFKNKFYKKITVSVLDSPNYKEDREVIPGLSGRSFEEFVIHKYGKSSNYYKAMVTGEIPDEDVDSLIPISWIERAENAEVHSTWRFIKRFITWDVADGGDDLHVMKAWENTTELDSVEFRGKKVEEAEPYVWRLLRQIGGNAIIVDADGIGRVAVGLLNQSKDKTVTIIPFEGSSRNVGDDSMFYNKRHEAHWKMRDLFEKRHISIKPDEIMKEELASIKLVDHTKGYIAIEPKKDLKERLNRSPDKADAVMMMAGEWENVPVLRFKNDYYKGWANPVDYPFNPMTV